MRTAGWVTAVAAVAAGIGALGYALHGWTLEGALAAARWTARWSFPWFLLAWSASSIARLWPGGWRRTLLRRRRAIGLSFAAAHLVHASFFLVAIFAFDLTRPLPLFIGGGIAYAFIIAMAVTSHDAAVRWLGARRWKRLHTVGGWVLMAVFVKSYFGRLIEAPGVAVIGSALILAALVLRFLAARRARGRANDAGASVIG